MSDKRFAAAREVADACSGTPSTGRRWWLAVAILTLAGGGLVLLATAKYGAGIWPDSVCYVDTARSLASGKGLVLHMAGFSYHAAEESLTSWPPLYPMLLGLIGFATRLDPTAFAHLVNAVLFGLVLCLSARVFQTGLRQSGVYGLLGVCAVLFSRPLSEVYAQTLSECLFIPLVLLYLIFAQRYWDSGGKRALAVMTLSTALACLTRYIGVALVPAGVATVILASKVNLKTRFTRAFAFAALSLAPLGLWAVRNYQLTGTLLGPRSPSGFTFVDNVILSAKTMISWYTPGIRGTKYIVLAGTAIAFVALVSSRTARRRASSSLRAILADQPPAVLLTGTYVLALLVSSTTVAYDSIDARLLSPAYVPATLILLNLAYHLLGPTRSITSVVARRAPVILLAMWLCFPLRDVALTTADRLRNGAGCYSTKTWRESETIGYVKRMLTTNDDVPVYSNVPLALWAVAGVNATRASSRWTGSLTDQEGYWPAENGSVLVWFKNNPSPSSRKALFSIEELGEIADVVRVALLSDGAIYRVLAREKQPMTPADEGPAFQACPRLRVSQTVTNGPPTAFAETPVCSCAAMGGLATREQAP